MDEYLSLLTGLVGTLIGGFITWLTTRYTLNRQFKEERNRTLLQERKNELIALNSVEKEIAFNLIELFNIEKVMETSNVDYFDFKAENFINILKKDKWDKHSDVIEMIDGLKFLGRLQGFYIGLSHEITKQVTTITRVKKLIDHGMSLDKEVKSYLEEYKKGR